jgi:cytochrome c2
MSKFIFLTAAVILSLGIIAGTVKKEAQSNQENPEASLSNSAGGKKFNIYCGACHWQTAPQNPIAPPIYNIKKRYTRSYPNETDFVKAMADWVEQPAEQEAVMPGAVQNFKTMPKLGYSRKDVEEIALYIYRTDFSPPVIPDSLRNKMGAFRGHGMGKGRGHGRGMGYGRRGNGKHGRQRGNRSACIPGGFSSSRPQKVSTDSTKLP